MKKVYPAILAQIGNGEGYVVKVPDIAGCVTTGATVEEALDNIKDALNGCICVHEDFGDPIPDSSIPANLNGKVIFVDVDTSKYRMETSNMITNV